MALNKTALTNALKAVLVAGYPTGVVTPGSIYETQMGILATGLADAIDAFVTSADIMYVTATLNSPSGTVTGAGTTIATLQ